MTTNLCCMKRTVFIINSQDSRFNWYWGADPDMINYLQACKFHNLQIDLSSFGRDFYDVSVSKNPLAHYAEKARLPICFSICLQSVKNNYSNHFYVIEFFLQPKYREDAYTDDSSMLVLLRVIEMKLKSFKFALGGQLPAELLAQSRQPPAIEFEFMLKSMDSNMEIFSELSDITKYLETVDSCYFRPSSHDSNEGWVFHPPDAKELYENDIPCHPLLFPRIPIKEKIQHFMKEMAATSRKTYCMVQFWAPKMVEGRCCLETSDQPYCLTYLAKGLISFRKKCIKHHYCVDEQANEGELGPPGRVFRNGLPELFLDLFLYSTKEFPMRSHAVQCGLRNYFALPVFDEHQQFNKHGCVGVLEFIGFEYFREVGCIIIALEVLSLSLFSVLTYGIAL